MTAPTVILGLNILHPDSSACLYVGDQLIGAVAQERMGRRIKHDLEFPIDVIRYLLLKANLKVKDIDFVAISRDPKSNIWGKLHFLTKSKRNLIPAVKSVLLRNRSGAKAVSDLANLVGFQGDKNNYKIINVEHHLSHVAASFFTSPFTEAAAISFDGSGDSVSIMQADCHDKDIKVLKRTFLPASLGHFYTAMCQLIGFNGFGEEYKVMGLAPYGKNTYVEQLEKIIFHDPEGNLILDDSFFRVGKAYEEMIISETGELILGNLYTEKLLSLLNLSELDGSKGNSQISKDLAKSTQIVFERIALQLLDNTSASTNSENLCLGGGCALNGVFNGKIVSETTFKRTHHHPAASDDGNAIGAALYLRHSILREPRNLNFFSPFTGPEFSDQEICKAINDFGFKFKDLKTLDLLAESAAKKIAENQVIAWYQGASEWGPRALGNRSILANPSHPNMKSIINKKIKKRESFRPFAPSVLIEDTDKFFEKNIHSPYMMHVVPFKKEMLKKFPSVVHVDGTGRLQTVSVESNPLYHKLISEVKKLTGYGIVLNTSFNENEPVVNSPEEALSCFSRTDIDAIYLGTFLVEKDG